MDRKEKISEMRKSGMTYREIGLNLNLSHERIRQIHLGISHKYIPKKLEDIKIYTSRKREQLGLPTIKNPIKTGGRDHLREIIRARDKYTCQECRKIWKEGTRRFDVHHDNENEGKSHQKGIIKLDKENIDKMITLCHKCHLCLHSVRKKMSVGSRIYRKRQKTSKVIV